MVYIIGPWIGSFEQEIITFRPYVRWLTDILDGKIYVNTHFNRFFLYKEFIDEQNLLPVYENLTRDELNQKGYVHKTIKPKDYQILIKNVKEKVQTIEGCNKKEVQLYNISYVKSTPPTPIFNKRFQSISHYDDVENEYKDKIIFIPSISDDRERLLTIKKFLGDDVIVIGDRRTRFRDCNVVLNRIDYVENGWKLIVRMISEAKAVVCPLSYWTTICNLQKTPVFSWGEHVGQHKPGGIYYFNNDNCLAFPASKTKVLLNMMDYFLREVHSDGKLS